MDEAGSESSRVAELLRSNAEFEARARQAERYLKIYEAHHLADFLKETRTFDLIKFMEDRAQWSLETFGPKERDNGAIDHIRKELTEIETGFTPEQRLAEWIDVISIALDGAWREGFSPADVCCALAENHLSDLRRKWPDWRNVEPGKAIEHVRD